MSNNLKEIFLKIFKFIKITHKSNDLKIHFYIKYMNNIDDINYSYKLRAINYKL